MALIFPQPYYLIYLNYLMTLGVALTAAII